MIALWQDPSFQKIAGGALRPGGLALTKHALAFCFEAKLLTPHGYAADMGAGTGASLELLGQLGFTAIGLDLCRSFSQRTSPSAQRLIADMTKPPLARGRFALLLFECVLSLVEQPDLVLSEARELLTPKGICLVSDLYGLALPNEPSCLGGARSLRDWQKLFQSQGLKVLNFENHSQTLRSLAAKLCWYGDFSSTCLLSHALHYGLWILGRE